MPNIYKRKHPNRNIDEINVENAIKDIHNKKESISSAAKKFGINRTTLVFRLKKIQEGKQINDRYSTKYSHKQILTTAHESELVEYFKKCSNLHFGLTYELAKQLVLQYVKINKIPYPNSWNVNKLAGKAWLTGFMRRNSSLSLRKPENTSLARLYGFKKAPVELFFQNLKRLYEQYKFGPEKIYNLDETGLTTVLDAPRVIAEKGKRTVSQVASAERGSLVTMVGIINAIGNHIPPVYVFPRKRMKPTFVTGSVTGSIGLLSDSGWMKSEIFPNVLAHLKQYSNCSKENPILLLLDNHTSHISLEAIIYCRENGIVMLSFPPHTSHKLQPLDVSIYASFKALCKKTFNNFLLNNPGKMINIGDIAHLTNQPFKRAFNPDNITAGFLTTGIFPYNDNIFSEDDYLEEHDLSYIQQPTASVSEMESATELNVPINSSNKDSFIMPETEPVNLFGCSDDQYRNPEHSPLAEVVDPIHVTPEALRPYPKMCKKKCRANTGISKVYTDTPEKNKLEALAAQKVVKDIKTKKNSKSPKPVFVKRVLDSETSSDEGQISLKDDSDTFQVSSEEEELPSAEGKISKLNLNFNPEINDSVLVKFGTKHIFYYVGIIQSIDKASSLPYTIKYYRRQGFKNYFYEPVVEDIGLALRADIAAKLPLPIDLPGSSRSRPKIYFNVDFQNFDVR